MGYMNANISAGSPFSLILFGASGHLAQIKIYPALYVLALKNRLPKDYAIVGFSRSGLDDKSFRKLVEDSIREHMPAVTEAALEEFLTHVYYHQGQYTEPSDFQNLTDRLQDIEKGWKDTVRLAYFSIPPSIFPDVSRNLCEGNVHDGKIPFRCIVEKPVGHDLESFESTKKQLLGCFQEKEIYLLDHYLGKEAIRNVYYLRHANPVLERIFKNTLIHHIEITAKENAGLSGRAGYFEAAGTFRDMFQSHLLMMASLLTMRLTSEDEIGAGRKDALKQFYLPPVKDLDDLVLQAQYTGGKSGEDTVPGYLEEEGVADGSRANTFACMKLMTRISRWDGIPLYLRSGKRLDRKETRISIVFQEPRSVGEGSSPNRLDIILQGEAGMRMHMQTKMGGTDPAFRPLVMEDPLVCVGDCLPEHSLLILEAIHGKRNWFLTFDEVQLAWRLVDPVLAHLDASDTPLHTYKAGTVGPAAAENWIEKDGIEWI
jgi:glucose-6-phosphate 1-dehydrogenase